MHPEGIKLLHKEKPAIVHRDLNISNLLLREDIHTWRGGSLSGWILICDFSPVGHPRYRAPELFNADAEYTTKVMLLPFSHNHVAIADGSYPFQTGGCIFLWNAVV